MILLYDKMKYNFRKIGEMAELKSVSFEKIAEVTSENAKKVFKI